METRSKKRIGVNFVNEKAIPVVKDICKPGLIKLKFVHDDDIEPIMDLTRKPRKRILVILTFLSL